jgi:hypothetical protein
MAEDQEDTTRKIIAIRKTAELGRAIQIDHPEVAELYRDGMSVRQIAIKLSLMDEYGEGLARCARAISYAVWGYSGSRQVPPYESLLPPSLRKELRSSHQVSDVKTAHMRKQTIKGVEARGQADELARQYPESCQRTAKAVRVRLDKERNLSE